jgi:(1->4)-alpha-D-glucan 1-alpha-D-glucosylmutase
VGGESVPDAAEELLLYQTLLGVMSPGPEDDEGLAGRVEGYALKAVREAKVRSSWIDPDLEREEALVSFVRSLFGPEGAELRGAMATFLTRLSPAGAANALAQALWKTTAPGVPDVYQGTERWFLRLVDPDNRSPARLESAQETLRSLPDADVSGIRVLSSSWQDGRIKLHVLRTGLNLRRSDPDLFERGSYVPIEARGTRSRHVLGFARRRGGRWAVTLTVRRGASMRAKRFPVGPVWHDTSLVLPNAAPSEWRDLLTGTKRRAESRELLLREVFADLPLALLVPHD